jgi:uncharacterized protein YciI
MLPRMKTARFVALLVLAGSLCAAAQSPSAATEPAPQAQQTAARKTWFVRLIPPRPTFAQDITPDEMKVMKEHFVYWKNLFDKGVCLFGGPVFDPKGSYGVLAIVADTEDEAKAIASADPSVKAGINKIEVAPMHIAFLPQGAPGGKQE